MSEKKQPYRKNYTKKDNIPPIVAMDIIKKPLTNNFEYVIRIGNDIKILENADIAKGFLEGLKFCGNNNGKLVSVEVENL